MTKYDDEFEALDWDWDEGMGCYVVNRNDANTILYKAECEIEELREVLKKIIEIKEASNYDPIVFRYNEIIKLVKETLERLEDDAGNV